MNHLPKWLDHRGKHAQLPRAGFHPVRFEFCRRYAGNHLLRPILSIIKQSQTKVKSFKCNFEHFLANVTTITHNLILKELPIISRKDGKMLHPLYSTSITPSD